MSDLSSLFTSKSKYKLLRTLCIHETPIHFRELAEMSDVPIRSAQLAMAKFVEDKVVKRKPEGNKVFYRLNRRHGLFDRVKQHFKKTSQDSLSKRAKSYKFSSDQLKTIDELNFLTWNVRKKRSIQPA